MNAISCNPCQHQHDAAARRLGNKRIWLGLRSILVIVTAAILMSNSTAVAQCLCEDNECPPCIDSSCPSNCDGSEGKVPTGGGCVHIDDSGTDDVECDLGMSCSTFQMEEEPAECGCGNDGNRICRTVDVYCNFMEFCATEPPADCDIVGQNGVDCDDLREYVTDRYEDLVMNSSYMDCCANNDKEAVFVMLVAAFIEHCADEWCDSVCNPPVNCTPSTSCPEFCDLLAKCIVDLADDLDLSDFDDAQIQELQDAAGMCDLDDIGDALDGNEADGKGEGPSDTDSCPTFQNASDNPVDLVYGDKLESIVDLRVPVVGKDFVVTRTYRSEPDYEAPPLLGEKWSLSVFRHIDYEDVSGDTFFRTGAGIGQHQRLLHDPDPPAQDPIHEGFDGDNRLYPEGSTTQYIERTSLDVGGTDYPVYRIVEPGRWANSYYRAKETSETTLTDPGDLIGFMAQTEDPFGNSHTYEYVNIKANTPRLDQIYLNQPATGDPDARIDFSWNMFSGRLLSIRVYRFDSDGESILTQKVSYRYMHETDSTLSADLGTDDDLVQVIKLIRVDPDSASSDDTFRTLITQYRYHGNSGESNGARDFTWVGNTNQLKMVILPEQIEYYAQQENDGASTSKSLATLAEELLDKNDDATAFTGGSAKVVDLAAKVIEEYETTGEKRVEVQYLQTACGCGGGSTQGYQQTYSYANTSTGKWTTRVVEKWYDTGTSSWKDHRTVYHDMEEFGPYDVPYLVTKAIIDDTAGSSLQWVTHYEFDDSENGDRNLVREFTPAATASYSPPSTFGGTNTDSTWTPEPSAGLVYRYEYTNSEESILDNRMSEMRVGEGDNGSSLANSILITKTTYGDAGAEWTTSNSRDFLVSKVERYRDETDTDPEDIEVTKFFYGFHTSGTTSEDVAWIETETEAELVAENGPGGSYSSFELFDDQGNSVWSIDESGTFTRRLCDVHSGDYVEQDYPGITLVDSRTGQVVITEQNSKKWTSTEETNMGLVIPGDAPSSDRYTDDGKSLVMTYIRDMLGRVQERITPGLVSTFMRREMREHPSRPDLEYYAEVTLPFEWMVGQDEDYNGPATITWYNADNDVIASRNYEVDSGGYSGYKTSTGGGYQSIYSTYDLKDTTSTDHIAASEIDHDISGLVTAQRVWHSVAGIGAGTGKYETTYTYDPLGRLEIEENPNETLTVYSDYDVLNRMLEVKVGTDPDESTGDLVTVAQYVYDGSGLTQGDGNGNVTLVRMIEDGSTNRDTEYTYDFRDRPIFAESPIVPHQAVAFDNLDRVTHAAVLIAVPTGTHDFGADDDDRQRLTVMHYSQRGLVYQQQLAVDPTDPTASIEFFATDTWYDEVGRAVGVRNINGPDNKTTYDGLGRPTVAYLTDKRTDAAPGATGNYADVYNATTQEADVVGDVIFEQSEYDYIDDEGLLDLVTVLRRTHNTTDSNTGDLGGIGTKLTIKTYSGTYFDDADRMIRSVNFGTNTTDFRYGGSEPSIIQASPPDHTSSDLVNAMTYNARGLTDTMTSPDGDVTEYVYDDLNRTIAIIEQQDEDDVGGDVNAVTWNGTLGRWLVSNVGGGGSPIVLDVDRATSFVYDGIGNVTFQTAHQPDDQSAGDMDQVTEYIYKVDTDTTGNPLASDLVSNNLLGQVIYPDEGAGGALEEARTVHYAYNRLGELIAMEDQNDTTHDYTRDELGRITVDAATVPGGSDIDDLIDSIEYEYTDFGLLQKVMSKDGSTIENAVEYAYESYWAINTIDQDNNSDIDVGGASPVIDYDWTVGDTDGINGFRVLDITAPGGGVSGYTYGSAGSSDDKAFRVREVGDSTGKVGYDHIGWNMIAEVDYQDPDVQLDYTASRDGTRHTQSKSGNSGIYPGYDKFGRVGHHMWVDGGFTTNVTGISNVPPIMEFLHSYDKDSNRTGSYDYRIGATQNLSYQYTYDGLDRLKKAIRGSGFNTLTQFAFIYNTGGEQWNLDMLGNWYTDEDPNPDIPAHILDDAAVFGTFDSSDTVQNRDHNDVNELEDIDGNALTYDDSGNLRLRDLNASFSYRYTHDAWNRLVEVEYVYDAGGGGESTNIIGEYDYNGLHQRTVRRLDSDDPPDNNLDQQRNIFYDASWRMCEEEIWDAWTSGTPGVIDRGVHYTWGMRYIDELLFRRIDGNGNGFFDFEYYHLYDVQFSSRIIIDSSADIIEWVDYTPYGVARHHPKYDVDGDGDFDGVDRGIVSQLSGIRQFPANPTDIDEAGYRAEADLNRDGTINSTDNTIANGASNESAIGAGLISTLGGTNGSDNQIGYDGYCFNSEALQYAVRYRVYVPALGRWIERDPAGYVDGRNLYESTKSSPVTLTDPFGLISDEDVEALRQEHRRLSMRWRAEFGAGKGKIDWCLVYLLQFKDAAVQKILAKELECRDDGYPKGCLDEVIKLKQLLGWLPKPKKQKLPKEPALVGYLRNVFSYLVPGGEFVTAAETVLQADKVNDYLIGQLKNVKGATGCFTERDCCRNKQCAAWLLLVKMMKNNVDWNKEKLTGAMP